MFLKIKNRKNGIINKKNHCGNSVICFCYIRNIIDFNYNCIFNLYHISNNLKNINTMEKVINILYEQLELHTKTELY